jgi:hypothetical protein
MLCSSKYTTIRSVVVASPRHLRQGNPVATSHTLATIIQRQTCACETNAVANTLTALSGYWIGIASNSETLVHDREEEPSRVNTVCTGLNPSYANALFCMGQALWLQLFPFPVCSACQCLLPAVACPGCRQHDEPKQRNILCGTKTCTVRLLRRLPLVYSTASLTPRTLGSGACTEFRRVPTVPTAARVFTAAFLFQAIFLMAPVALLTTGISRTAALAVSSRVGVSIRAGPTGVSVACTARPSPVATVENRQGIGRRHCLGHHAC